MLELVVLWHETGEDTRELLDLTGKLELLDKAICVLSELLWLDLLISVELVDSVVKLFNLLAAFLVLSSFVVGKVLGKSAG